jgi:uncharacterized protein
MNTQPFAPHQALAGQLSPFIEAGGDGAHDLSHVTRVWRNATLIQAEEGGDLEIIAAAVLLHDSVSVAKNSPERNSASKLAAVQARTALAELGWAAGRIEQVAHAIESHSYSGGVVPRTLEARIVQDADRLDAIGMTGIARCFYTAGRMGSALYDAADPRGEERPLDDLRYALDHFPKKLFRLGNGFHTTAGQRLAHDRQDELQHFYDGLLSEIGWG